MRLLSLAALLAATVATAFAEPPKVRTVKVDDTLTVPLTLDDDVTRLVVARPDILTAKADPTPDRRHITITVIGVSPGTAEILIDAAGFYSLSVEVVAKDSPVPTVIPVVPAKRVPPADSPATIPAPAPPVAAPKAIPAGKVGSANPTVRPSLVFRPTATASTIRGTSAPRAAVASSFGTKTLPELPASAPATIRTNAPPIVPSGGTMKAGGSGYQSASG